MNQQLESDLRAVLRERAGAVPDTAAARVARVDYRPRTRGLGAPVAMGATALTAAAAGAAVLVVSLGAGAGNAFAGWTPKPTKAPPAQLAAAAAGCAGSPSVAAPLKLTDTRGPFTFSIYADSQSSATCIKGPSNTAVHASGSSSPVSVPDDRILLTPAHVGSFQGPAFSLIDGRTGAGVSGVTLVLADGTKVQATVGNGWYLAWWPGARQVTYALLDTSAGAVTQKVSLADACRSTTPSGPCEAKQGPGGGTVTSVHGGNTVHVLPGSSGSK
jgi:hypothetical protein